MTATTITLWLLNVFLETGGQMFLKVTGIKSMSGAIYPFNYWVNIFSKPWIWIAFCCYFLQFLIWLAFLSLVSLSQGMLLGSINIVAIMIGGHLIFGEKVNFLRLSGILLIAIGVAIVGVN
jgi:drug/metabolite transporter (DMT)-like permease